MSVNHYVKDQEAAAGLAHSETVVGPLYKAHHYGLHVGWVGRNAEGQWIGWNPYGDFWISYGISRDKACAALMDESWRFFTRKVG